MVAALVDGLEVDFPRLLIFVIHERAFKAYTTYPFACMIFKLCGDAGVLIWLRDVLHTFTGIVDIDVIRDDANVAAPRRGPRFDMQPLGENLADMIEQPKGADHTTSKPTDTTPVESAPALVGHQVPPGLCPHQQYWSRLLGSKS